MAKIADTSTAAQRRSAQRLVAKQLREGTYERGAPGRANQAARARQRKGVERQRVEVGSTGIFHLQREFGSIGDACHWAVANLPPRGNCYLLGYGRLHAQSGDPDDMGKVVWRALADFTKAGQMLGAIPYAEAEAARLFSELRRVMLRWEE